MLVQQVEREQRMAQVVEHAQEQHDVEALAERGNVVDGELAELDLGAADLGGEARLGEVAFVGVDSHHAVRAAPLHLDRVEAGVAADIEHGLAAQVRRERVGEVTPLDGGVVAQEMVGRGLNPAQVEVVEPLAEVAVRAGGSPLC